MDDSLKPIEYAQRDTAAWRPKSEADWTCNVNCNGARDTRAIVRANWSRKLEWHDCVGAWEAAWAEQSHRHHRRNRGRVNKLVEKDGGGPPITRSLTMEKLLDKETNSSLSGGSGVIGAILLNFIAFHILIYSSVDFLSFTRTHVNAYRE